MDLEIVCYWIYKRGGFLMHDLLLIFHTCGEAMCLSRLGVLGLYIHWKKILKPSKSTRIFKIIL